MERQRSFSSIRFGWLTAGGAGEDPGFEREMARSVPPEATAGAVGGLRTGAYLSLGASICGERSFQLQETVATGALRELYTDDMQIGNWPSLLGLARAPCTQRTRSRPPRCVGKVSKGARPSTESMEWFEVLLV